MCLLVKVISLIFKVRSVLFANLLLNNVKYYNKVFKSLYLWFLCFLTGLGPVLYTHRPPTHGLSTELKIMSLMSQS